jgi:predicted transcriptional regulator of viral defense system
MRAEEILKKIITPEFDYNILIDSLKGYKFPRNKIGSLIKSKQIIRVKKGVYVKAQEDYHPFIVANMIYGPSYVSEDSALSYYGLIPERVETVTSTTLSRKRSFSTPLGEFQFNLTQKECFSLGIERVQVDEQRAFLIATPEKALFDRLYHVEGIETLETMFEFLFKNMRLELSQPLNHRRLTSLAKLSGKKFARTLVELIEREWRSYE